MNETHAKLLDCTLRDGAYLIDKKFGDEYIHGIIQGLLDANVDIIEIGFFQDEGFGEGKTVFKNSKDAKRFIPDQKGNTLFTVLADFSRYSVSNLDECDSSSIDAIRACFFRSERKEVIDFCKKVKEKGYKLFVQPVDILGYSDIELIDLINDVNSIEPYCFSIVDTFGSMYVDDLSRVFSLINHNLTMNCLIGFHSHNNMQMSNALSQEFLRMTYGLRKVIVDTTISGMGRGAGNTPTELVMDFMIKKLGYSYKIDAILDLIDNYMDNIRTRCDWGYSTNMFLCGSYSAHVNNIAYLTKKNSISYKDIRFILNKIGSQARKRYPYELLEQTYVDYLDSQIDDSDCFNKLKNIFKNKNIVIIAPGKKANDEKDKIIQYVQRLDNYIVVSINFVPGFIKSDYIYMSNKRRYNYWKNNVDFINTKKILVSNIKKESDDDFVISFNRLVKCGWDCMDNSSLMLLRLLDQLEVSSIAIAGMDGYSINEENKTNYADEYLELYNVHNNPNEINREISEMLIDFINTRMSKAELKFITSSKFAYITENEFHDR